MKWNTRATSAILAAVTTLSISSPHQRIVENSNIPDSQKSGRILNLKETWRIKDGDGAFYLKSPFDLRRSSDGSVFLGDESELLKFSPDGTFLKNLYKAGQGPGEINGDFSFTIEGDTILIYDFMSNKIVQMDLDGTLLDQIQLKTGPYNRFCGVYRDEFVFLKEIYQRSPPLDAGLQNIPVIIKRVSKDGKLAKDGGLFSKEIFVEGSRLATWTIYNTVLDGKSGRLYVCHTRNYQIVVLDIARGETTKIIKRKYASLDYKERGWEDAFYRSHSVPRIKFEPDISSLHLNEDRLWVRTSTTSKAKGDLIDVFDGEGRFLDNFHLGPGKTFLLAEGKDVFLIEQEIDGGLVLKKYQILD